MSEGVRMAPYSEEGERGVLGSLLVDAERLLPVLRGKLRIRGEWFFVPAHRVVWETICEMADGNRPIELLSVTERLQTLGRVEEIGGATALDKMVDATPTSAHAEYYAEQVREKFYLRGIIEAARAAVQGCYDGESAQEVVARTMGTLQVIGAATMPEMVTNREVVDTLIGNWERALDQRQSGGNVMPGLRTPLNRLNEILGGMQPGLHFYGGKSSAGKTTPLTRSAVATEACKKARRKSGAATCTSARSSACAVLSLWSRSRRGSWIHPTTASRTAECLAAT